LTDSNPWNGIIPTIQNLKKDIINKFKIEQEEADLIVEFTQEIANLFSRVGANYNLSAFIADSILYSENVQKFVPNILVFPSVESQKNSCNIAINTDFAEKYLVLKKVVKMKITEVFADNFKADISTIGQVEMGRVQFYHFNFDASRAEYTIDTVKCGCGISFRLKDPENFILWIRGKQISLKEVVSEEGGKWVKEDDLLSYNEGLFDHKGIANYKILKVTIPLPNASLKRGGKNHTNIFCELTVKQPFNYIKENDNRFNSRLNNAL
jgi:hypothetical protein